MPSAAIRYPASVFGYSSNAPADGGSTAEPFVAAAAITKGHAVELDFTTSDARVKAATTNGGTQLFVGIAQDGAAAAGEVVLVTMFGMATAKVSTNVTVGDRLNISATTAGELATVAGTVAVTQTQHLGSVRAVALETITTASATNIRVLVARL